MKRTTILNAIEYELRESLAETGQARPLGEIVARVASQIRVEESLSITPRVIPVEQIAAFVDGELTVDETEAICNSVKTDNSVLAEIIAAVRATNERNDAEPPALSNALERRLEAMAPRGAAHDFVTRPDLEPPPVEIDGSDDRSLGNIGQRRRMVAFAAAALAIAASLIMLAVWFRPDNPPQPNETQFVHREPTPDESQPTVPLPDPQPESIETETNMLVDRKPDLDPIAPSIAPAPHPEPNVVENDSPDRGMAPKTPENSIVDSEPIPKSPIVEPKEQRAPRLADFRWTEISGLLTRQAQSPVSASSESAPERWMGVSIASRENPFPESANRVVMRTMPLSRAQAELVNGGKLVIASDTAMLLQRSDTTASADIQLIHGSLAAVDFPKGTVLNFRSGNKLLTSMRWTSDATTVIERSNQTLNVYVHRGTVKINEQTVEKAAVSVREDEPIRTIEKPKRLATWVSRPVETISVPRPVLAQISESENVLVSLNERVNSLSRSNRLSTSDQRQLAMLARWQASMVGPSVLYRLAGSRVPALRFAAIERLVELPPSDPRSVRMWRSIQQSVSNPQRVVQIRRWCMTISSGAKPTAKEIENIALSLGADDVAQRALSDYLLRKLFGGGPVFDPTWTGTTQLRGVNLWRKKIGLRPLTRTGVNQPAANRGNRPNQQ